MPEEPLPLEPRVQHKFYEPIILFEALNFATRNTAQLASHAESVDTHDPQQFFHAFVYKLAHLCDYKQGGTTVTSLAVLQDGRDAKTALYKFAVNQQKIEQLEETQRYVEGLLKKVDQLISASCGRLPLRAKIHRDIMLFNKPRILVYLRQLQAQLVDCRTLCDNNRSDDGTLLLLLLSALSMCGTDCNYLQTPRSLLGLHMLSPVCELTLEIAT